MRGFVRRALAGCVVGFAVLSGTAEAQQGIVSGPGAGGGPVVYVRAGLSGSAVRAFFARAPQSRAGARVALADIDGDAIGDYVTIAGAGEPAAVGVFSGASGAPLAQILAYGGGFTGGGYVATGDVNGDGRADVVTCPGAGGGARVRVFDGANLAVGRAAPIADFFAFDPGFTGGCTVAVGDVTGDGRVDIAVAAGPGGGPHVKVFDGRLAGVNRSAEVRSFFTHDPALRSGLNIALGDVDGDGIADLAAAPMAGGGAQVNVFSAATQGRAIASFQAYPGFGGGASVAIADLSGDRRGEIVTGAGPGGAPHVKIFEHQAAAQRAASPAASSAVAAARGGSAVVLRAEYLAYEPAFAGGVHVAAGSLR